MTSYAELAYSDERVREAVKEAGYSSFKRCVAEHTTLGYNLTDVANALGLSVPRLCSYYQQWCIKHAEPLRLGETE